MARAIPSFADNTHSGEGRRESYVGARQPLQESSAHIGRATGGGASATTTTSSTISPKIEPKHQAQEQGQLRRSDKAGVQSKAICAATTRDIDHCKELQSLDKMDRSRPWYPFRLPGMCGLCETAFILTLISVTICLIIFMLIIEHMR